MSDRYLTIADGDPRLNGFLLGETRDDGARPLLIQSSPDWTFEFVHLKDLRRPFWMLVWIRALRPDSLVLSVGPILGALGWLIARSQATGELIELKLACLTVIGILALHAAVNLFNDYHDHMRGWDLVREHGGARVISRGWLRAKDVHRAAWAAFLIAIAAGAPVVFSNFSSGLLLALFALVAVLEFAISRFGLKYRGFAEVTAWFMFGPLLTGGFMWAMTGQVSFHALALGAVYGSLALLCLHLKNFERILVDGRAGLRTWPVRAGFDASKTFTIFCLGLILAAQAFVFVIVDPAAERIVSILAVSLGMGPLASRVMKLKSPLAGRMHGLHRAGLLLAWLNLVALTIGDLIRNFTNGFFR